MKKFTAIVITLLFLAFTANTAMADQDPDAEYEALAFQADEFLTDGDTEAAIPILEQMHALKPAELVPLEYLGILYANTPDARPNFTHALPLLLEAESRFSEHELVYYNLACVYSIKGDSENAVRALDKAIFFRYWDFDWMSKDDDLVNFRTSGWWKKIENHYGDIAEQMSLFREFAGVEDEKTIEERIRFYISSIAALEELTPHIPALQYYPLIYLISSLESSNTQDFVLSNSEVVSLENCYLKRRDIIEKTLGREHPYYAMSLNNLGMLYQDMSDYARAETCLLEAKTLWEKVLGREHPDYAIAVNNLGSLYQAMGDYVRAEACYMEAKAIREKVLGREDLDYATSVNNLGSLYRAMGDYARAETFLLEAKAINEKVLGREHPSYATSVYNLGWLYQAMGDYVRAESCFLEAKTIWEKMLGPEHPSYAALVSSLGLLYQAMGDYARAETFLLEAKAIDEKVLGREHPGYATDLNNLGMLYYAMGDYAKAETCYLEAKAIDEKVLGREHPDYASLVNNLGMLYKAMGDYTKAETFLLEAKAIYEKVLGREHPDYAMPVNNLGLLYDDMGDYARAETYYLEAKAIYEKALGREHPYYAKSVNNISFLYQDMGDYTLATSFKENAIELTVNQVNQNFLFLSEQQRTSYWNTQLHVFEGSYSLSHFHPIAAVNNLNYNNTLFSKGLLLRTTVAVRDSINSSGNQDLIDRFERLGRLRNEISRLQQNGGNQDYIKKLETEAEELDKSLNRDSAAFRELNADMALKWQNVRDSLKADEAAIEFVSFRLYDKKWTRQTYYAALILRPGMETPLWVPLCEETKLSDLLAKTKEKDSAEQAQILYDDLGAELYTAVWQPLEKELTGVKTVFYAASGLLHKIAFAAIPVSGDKKTRLVDRYDLNLVSSTREVATRNRAGTFIPTSAVVYGGLQYSETMEIMQEAAQGYNKTSKTDERLASVAVLFGGSNRTRGRSLDYLPHTLTESIVIERQLNEQKIKNTRYSGSKGNEESFKDLDGSKTSVIHLATHGFFLEDLEKDQRELVERLGGGGAKAAENPLLRSGLIFSGGSNAWSGIPIEGVEDGILTADEIARLNLTGTGLVVLSACQTGLGDVNNSEGVFGLQRAFKLAGVETLIMSLWEVSDTATAELMTTFYRQWLGGKSKQEAFKDAQRLVRAKHPQPYFWAAFVLMD